MFIISYSRIILTIFAPKKLAKKKVKNANEANIFKAKLKSSPPKSVIDEKATSKIGTIKGRVIIAIREVLFSEIVKEAVNAVIALIAKLAKQVVKNRFFI